jgi:hypothetical protein
MTVASKLVPSLKLHCGDILTCRTSILVGEAEVLREETGISTEGTLRGKGPSTYTRIMEIMSGRADSQQRLATTCKDPTYKDNPRRWEGFGLAHEFI